MRVEFSIRNLRENEKLMPIVRQPEDSTSAIATEVLQREIQEKIQEFGMDAVGFSSVRPPVTGSRYKSWLDAGMHAGMEYLQRHSEKKLNPDLILPGAKSMISVLVNYSTDTEEAVLIGKKSSQQPSGPVIARYARHLDYHDTF
jgi:epoxyqueuosine reductase